MNTIGQKLSLGFGIIFLFMLLIGGVASYSLIAIKNHADAVSVFSLHSEKFGHTRDTFFKALDYNRSYLEGNLENKFNYETLLFELDSIFSDLEEIDWSNEEQSLLQDIKQNYDLLKSQTSRVLQNSERVGDHPVAGIERNVLLDEIDDLRINIINSNENLHYLIKSELEEAKLSAGRVRDWGIYATIGISLLSLVFGAGGSLFFTRRFLTNPLNKLKEAAIGVGSGKYETTIEITSKDEMGILARTFETMAGEIEKHTDNLEGVVGERTKELNSALNEIKQKEKILRANQEKLKIAKEQAEKANEAKRNFLATMSHELRTPLHAILGFSQLLQKTPEEPLSVDQAENVEQIYKSGKHLLELIDDVLDLSLIESGKLTLSPENIHLASLVEDIFNLIQPMADQFGIKIIDQITDKSDLYVFADRIRLKQVLLNLISNAVKYNREEGSVTLSQKRLRDDRLRISVLDTGIGIPEDKQEVIFQPFNRLHPENLYFEGTGIGLTISRQLLEQMNGTIGLDSVPSKGSCFYIELPIGESQPLEVDHIDGQQKTLLDQEDQPKKEHILLYVEDNPASLNMVEKILRQRPSIELLSAPDAQLGLDLARAHRPDLILMDINLPGMDGFTALKYLKGYEETRDIPVIAVSASAMERDVKKAMSAGFHSYITKPFDIPKFLKIISENLDPKFT